VMVNGSGSDGSSQGLMALIMGQLSGAIKAGDRSAK